MIFGCLVGWDIWTATVGLWLVVVNVKRAERDVTLLFSSFVKESLRQQRFLNDNLLPLLMLLDCFWQRIDLLYFFWAFFNLFKVWFLFLFGFIYVVIYWCYYKWKETNYLLFWFLFFNFLSLIRLDLIWFLFCKHHHHL